MQSQTEAYPTLADIPATIPQPYATYALIDLYSQQERGVIRWYCGSDNGWMVQMGTLPAIALTAWCDGYLSAATGTGEEGANV